MVEKLRKRITIWHIKCGGKKLERLERGLKELIVEGWQEKLPISIHSGNFRTLIEFPIEEMANVANVLRKHIGEFLPNYL